MPPPESKVVATYTRSAGGDTRPFFTKKPSEVDSISCFGWSPKPLIWDTWPSEDRGCSFPSQPTATDSGLVRLGLVLLRFCQAGGRLAQRNAEGRGGRGGETPFGAVPHFGCVCVYLTGNPYKCPYEISGGTCLVVSFDRETRRKTVMSGAYNRHTLRFPPQKHQEETHQ